MRETLRPFRPKSGGNIQLTGHLRNKSMCSICRNNDDTRFVDLPVFGSEGIHLCNQCEINVCDYIRLRSSEASRMKIRAHKAAKLAMGVSDG